MTEQQHHADCLTTSCGLSYPGALLQVRVPVPIHGASLAEAVKLEPSAPCNTNVNNAHNLTD